MVERPGRRLRPDGESDHEWWRDWSLGAGANLVAGGTATASFVRTDTTTKGNWRTAYGGEGFAVVGDTTNYPPYAQVVTTGNGSYVWDTSPTDVRALQRAVGSGRVAATWVADTTFDIDVNVTDGQVHQVAIYCMDWDSTERVQRIDVLNAITGAVLDTRTIKGFNGGQYLVWNVSGGVTLRVTRVGPINAIVEGIFFGSANSTTATLTTPLNGAAYMAPANVVLNATASTTSGTISKVEFFQGTTKLGEDLTVAVQPDLVERSRWRLFLDRESHEQRWRVQPHRTRYRFWWPRGICRSVVRTLRIRLRKVTGAGRLAGMVSQWSAIPPATRRTPRWFRADILPGSGRPRPAMSERCSARSATAASRPRGMHPRRSTSA